MNAVSVGGVSARALISLLLITLFASGACGGKSTPTAAPSPTPLAELPSTGIQLPRIEFCSLIAPDTIAAALGQPTGKIPRGTSATSYGNGDEVELGPDHIQLLQELGCTWTLGTESAAAWIFARPVDREFAGQVIAAARTQKRCTIAEGGFGEVGLSQECPQPDGTIRVRHAGLFGQTWFTCQVRGTGDVASRAELWCSSLVNELDAT